MYYFLGFHRKGLTGGISVTRSLTSHPRTTSVVGNSQLLKHAGWTGAAWATGMSAFTEGEDDIHVLQVALHVPCSNGKAQDSLAWKGAQVRPQAEAAARDPGPCQCFCKTRIAYLSQNQHQLCRVQGFMSTACRFARTVRNYLNTAHPAKGEQEYAHANSVPGSYSETGKMATLPGPPYQVQSGYHHWDPVLHNPGQQVARARRPRRSTCC